MKLTQLELDEGTDIEKVHNVLTESYVQLKFESLDIFKKCFNKFFPILWDYAEKIKSLEVPGSGVIFEDTVAIISELEDKLEININHVVINARFHEDIKQLIDFYYDDLQDGSLTIGINVSSDEEEYETVEVFKTPIEIIAYIERNKLAGVTMCISCRLLECAPWAVPGLYRKSIRPYLSAIYLPVGIIDLL